jgi:hypothetical protein
MVYSSEPWWVTIVGLLVNPGTLLALIVIVIFRKQIAEQIGKIKGFSAAGVSADLANAQESVSGTELSATIAATANIAATSSGVTPGGREAPSVTFPGIMGTAHAVGETAKLLGPDANNDAPMERLARYWALAWNMEHTYWLIFGTQLKVVQNANAAPVEKSFIQEQYRASVRLGNKQTFEQYVGFLTTSLLLKPSENDTYSILIAGRMLLLYITVQGYTGQKGL